MIDLIYNIHDKHVASMDAIDVWRINISFTCILLDFNNCLSSPCLHGTCQDALNGFICSCDTGFTGHDCDINIDDCGTNICLNNATCVDDIAGYNCFCSPTFTGTYCEIQIGKKWRT